SFAGPDPETSWAREKRMRPGLTAEEGGAISSMDSPIPPARRRRFSLLLPVLLFSFAACRIEQTPTRYIDRLETPEEEIQASMEELTDRLLSTAPSLQRRDLGDVLAALAPHPDMAALAPASDTVLTSATQLGLALSQAAEGGGIEMSDLDVEVSPENTVA